MRTIAVYSEPDENALHVRIADEAVAIGSAAARDSYLNVAAIIAAARSSGARCIHPGYGFLSENAEFARACAETGVVFVGPPESSIRMMGSKSEARRLMAATGVPVLPGYDGVDQAPEQLHAAALRIGYPLLIKPTAGGGGKGMRIVRDLDRLPDAIAAGRREAAAAFGDERLILERFLEGPRHVEVQVLFDGHGNGIELGERDCSIQRRHQKILEETPSPAVGPNLRARLGEAALTLAGAVGYVSAGTCEFLVDDRGEPVFLEMNTRLQVEHPVTELVTGHDLVEDQLRIAAGEALDVDQAAVTARGHAIEVRLYAEDAEHGFLPATGMIEALRWPTGAGIRIDAGIRRGDEVTGRFDPMLAKVIAHGTSRQEALDRLTGALDQTVVLGVTTNLRFLRWLARQPVVRQGEARIDTLDRIWPPDDWTERTALPDEAWAAAAATLHSSDATDPWRGGWRLNGKASVRLETGGEQRTIGVPASIERDTTVVRAGDTAFVDVAGLSVAFQVAGPPDVDRAARAAASHAGGPAELVAPMPGSVLEVHAEIGASVGAGDPILTLEAMKMEHAVVAPTSGRVAELRVAAGDQVTRAQILGVIEP
jgi:acetyl/propionyl-CoA carboxylase alpha subunit